MRQRRWLELIKDYDCEINYHSGKANVVADALSKKSMVELVSLEISQPQLIRKFAGMGLDVADKGSPVHLANLMVQSKLLARIKAPQLEDPECAKIKQLFEEGKAREFCLKDDGLLTHFKLVCVPKNGECGTKMYQYVKGSYWWNNTKQDIARERMSAAQSRQKSYADNRRQPLEFDMGDRVFLKISPIKE
ncbi:uncharacterized protein LOC132190918 [Corylus avellana]|uniref:uncharacterized protein LOC132190918 n=1 Tax=Corylus avellana TaxID=13451 RepID=UPI00286BE78D|nr:uncharacterized protein LOC132190918 [Corylus avellana]